MTKAARAGDPFADGGEQPTDFRRDLVYSVFGALPEQRADAVAGRLGRATLPAGTIIVRQGGPAEKFFIIVDGIVDVIREDGGSGQVVATLGPGEFFGEVAILRDMPRTATVRAVTAVSLLTMDSGTFRSLVAQSLGITADFDEIIRPGCRISPGAPSDRHPAPRHSRDRGALQHPGPA